METTTENKKRRSITHPFNNIEGILKTSNQGKNVALFRTIQGLTQKQLADKMHVSQQTVSDMEKKEVLNDNEIQQAAEALGIKPEILKRWNQEGSNSIICFDRVGDAEGQTQLVGTNIYQTLHKTVIHPLDKICLLYDKIIADKDNTINKLMVTISDFKNEVEQLRTEIKKQTGGK